MSLDSYISSFPYFAANAMVFVYTESEWLKWWSEVGIFQMTSTTSSGGPQVTSKWNWGFDVTTDDQQTQSAAATTKWNMPVTDANMGKLTSEDFSAFVAGHACSI